MPNMDALSENTIRGNVYVSVRGTGTSNTEYELLTGNIGIIKKFQDFQLTYLHVIPQQNLYKNQVFPFQITHKLLLYQ